MKTTPTRFIVAHRALTDPSLPFTYPLFSFCSRSTLVEPTRVADCRALASSSSIKRGARNEEESESKEERRKSLNQTAWRINYLAEVDN